MKPIVGGLLAFANGIRRGDQVYLVGLGGEVRSMDVDAYEALSPEELRETRVFTQPSLAERYAEIRRARRN